MKIPYDYCKKYEEWLDKDKVKECDKENCKDCEYKKVQWVEVD